LMSGLIAKSPLGKVRVVSDSTGGDISGRNMDVMKPDVPGCIYCAMVSIDTFVSTLATE